MVIHHVAQWCMTVMNAPSPTYTICFRTHLKSLLTGALLNPKPTTRTNTNNKLPCYHIAPPTFQAIGVVKDLIQAADIPGQQSTHTHTQYAECNPKNAK